MSDALIEALDNYDPLKRHTAIMALINVEDGRHTPALRKALSSHDPRTRERAAIALAARPDPTQIHLRLQAHEAAAHDDPDIVALLDQRTDHPLVALARQEAALARDPERLASMTRDFMRTAPARAMETLGSELLPVAVGVARRRMHAYNASKADVERWLASLRLFEGEDTALWAAANFYPSSPPLGTVRHYLKGVDDIFAGRLEEPLRWHMRRRYGSHHDLVLGWLNNRGIHDRHLLFKALDSAQKAMRLQAIRGLTALGETVIDEVLTQLVADRKDTRAGAAVVLAHLGDPRAAESLREALAKEKTKAGKTAMRKALRLCDPAIELDERDRRVKVPETYDTRVPSPTSDLLEALRSLLYDNRGSLADWVQLCNLFERFREVGATSIAVDYALGHGVEKWDPRLKPIPWGWSEEPELTRLAGPSGDLEWVPIHALFRGQGEVWLRDHLPEMEKRYRARCFDLTDLPHFVAWVRRTWAWCPEHDIPLEDLEVQADGGTVAAAYMGRATTTALTLFHRYGAKIHRTKSLITPSGARAHGVQRVRALVPSDHPLRTRIPELQRRRHLDLIEWLGPLETP